MIYSVCQLLIIQYLNISDIFIFKTLFHLFKNIDLSLFYLYFISILSLFNSDKKLKLGLII